MDRGRYSQTVGEFNAADRPAAREGFGATRIGYMFLCALPFLDIGIVAVRALRAPGVYQAIGAVLFAAIVIAAWILGARVIGSGAAGRRRLALAGALLAAPWAMISLLWVGLWAPFQATQQENYMRFLVLLASAAIVPGAFVAPEGRTVRRR